jgi:hypothetical protein
VSGMQTARLKAESQGRKAKVNPKTRMAEEWMDASSSKTAIPPGIRKLTWCNSLPTRTMSYWSMFLFPSNGERRDLLTGTPSQRIFVERSSIGWQLHIRSFDWERVFWKGLPCYT